MEEIPSPTTRLGSLVCLLLSGAAGTAGAALGALRGQGPYSTDWDRIPALRLAQILIAGFLVGIGVAVAALQWRPATLEWAGVRPTVVLIVTSMLASALLTGLGAYWYGRLT